MKTLMLHDIDCAWYRRCMISAMKTQHEVDLYCVKVSIRIDHERGTCGECHLIWEAGNISAMSRPCVHSTRVEWFEEGIIHDGYTYLHIWGSVGCREHSSRNRLAYCISSKIIRHLANADEWRTPEQVACRMHMRTSTVLRSGVLPPWVTIYLEKSLPFISLPRTPSLLN